ncbi:hypothetical protein HMH01_13180 [Halovulum dunhuangense]|uniref:Uncharacterized protein n=1 Tax=Halovulum dunhuangense TaxID=1505036 RepID=A0A849L4W0_9RHOB|nr:hypothetical protein [Halovulum dunhuangense]NNU81389.1 hypothetical protein [Halovulum dunhuangense]
MIRALRLRVYVPTAMAAASATADAPPNTASAHDPHRKGNFGPCKIDPRHAGDRTGTKIGNAPFARAPRNLRKGNPTIIHDRSRNQLGPRAGPGARNELAPLRGGANPLRSDCMRGRRMDPRLPGNVPEPFQRLFLRDCRITLAPQSGWQSGTGARRPDGMIGLCPGARAMGIGRISAGGVRKRITGSEVRP